jgi:hypothetical protein
MKNFIVILFVLSLLSNQLGQAGPILETKIACPRQAATTVCAAAVLVCYAGFTLGTIANK